MKKALFILAMLLAARFVAADRWNAEKANERQEDKCRYGDDDTYTNALQQPKRKSDNREFKRRSLAQSPP